MNEQERDSNIVQFEIEMRTTLAKLSVQQEDLTKSITEYLEKTINQEVKISHMESEIETLFHGQKDLREEMRRSREDLSKIIEDKIDSIYKMAGVTAAVVSSLIAILGMLIKMH